MIKMSKLRFLAATGVAAALGIGAFGYAASNTVPESGAGDGANTISGYTVSAVKYNLASNSTDIDSWQFSLTPIGGNPAPTVVRSKIVATSTTYVTCTLATSTWTCDPTTNVSVASADDLRVIAVQ